MRLSTLTFILLASLASPPLLSQGEDDVVTSLLPTPQQARAYLKNASAQIDNSEQLLWMAQAEISLGEQLRALSHLQHITSSDPLFLSASKLRIYIARQHGEAALNILLQDLSTCDHLHTQQLALVMLLELAIKDSRLEEAEELMTRLSALELPDELACLRDLHQIDILRLRGDYQGALNAGRALESSESESLDMDTRARIRLKLAEVYYARALQGEQSARDRDRGKAEETLLSFISTYPESPLIEDAFQMLYEQNTLQESNTALTRLKRWIEPEELMKARRAALSLKMLFLLQDPLDPEPNLNYVNTALAALPQLEASQLILQEAARRLLATGQLDQALQYIKLIDKNTPYGLFFSAQLLADEEQYAQAAELFQHVADSDSQLRDAAHMNAIICAMRSGQEELAKRLIHQTYNELSQISILSAQSAHYLHRQAQLSRKYAQQLIEEYPDSSQAIDARMDLIQIDLEGELTRAESGLKALAQLDEDTWSTVQFQRFFALKVLLAKKLFETEQDELAKLTLAERRKRKALYPSPIKVVQETLLQSRDIETQSFLTLFLGDLLFEQKKYHEALILYVHYAQSSPLIQVKALAYLLAARCAEKLSSLASLKQAIELYIKCYEIDSIYSQEACIGAASLYVRIGEEEKARKLLSPLLETDTSPEQRSLIHCILADAWAYEAIKNPELIPHVLDHSSAMLNSPELSLPWLNRSRIHHAHLCARFGLHHEAIKYYQLVIDSLQAKPTLKRSEWYRLYHASSAKIIHLLELKSFRKAADYADELAHWVRAHHDAEDHDSLIELADRLREWATSIRQENFILPTQADKESE